MWAVDHAVIPQRTMSPYLLGRKPTSMAAGAIADELTPNFEQLTTLAWVAGFTERIGLGTAVTVLTNRPAVLTARQLATIDRHSGGRLAVGVGVGWVREEAEIIGMPWPQRGRRAEEQIALMRRLWTATDEFVDFHGEFYDLPPMLSEPLPVQRPIPLYVGGHTRPALERAGRLADGWVAAPMSASRVAECRDTVRQAATRAGRDPLSVKIVACATPNDDDRTALVASYAKAGADHLQLRLAADPVAVLVELEYFARIAERFR
ncbi:TIGR03619 family F420-dependent LLM class oxidoreductase [Mycolicibacterium farcinogenes]|nr:TIGR03619 family F420-dependent LLM class oxidoreductase [Mycolicibacterium farcinogenes]